MLISRSVCAVLVLGAGLLLGLGVATTGFDAAEAGNGPQGMRLGTADVVMLPPGSPPLVLGVSRLLRTPAGIGFDIETTGLTPGHPHSFWVFIDENAAAPPGPPPVQAFELRLAVGGGFASPEGTQRFNGFLPSGALPPADGASVTDVDDGFFDSPMTANISVAVRAHGAPIPGMEYQQTNTLFGGCPPNDCATIQAALHMGPGN